MSFYLSQSKSFILLPFHKLLHNILIIFYPINTFTMISQVIPNRSISQDDVRISQRENRTDGNSCISTWLSSQAKSGRPWSTARDDPRERRTSRERISTERMRISMMRFPDSAECARGVNVQYTLRCMQIRYTVTNHHRSHLPDSLARSPRLVPYLPTRPRDVVVAIRRYRLQRAGLTASLGPWFLLVKRLTARADAPLCDQIPIQVATVLYLVPCRRRTSISLIIARYKSD